MCLETEKFWTSAYNGYVNPMNTVDSRYLDLAYLE